MPKKGRASTNRTEEKKQYSEQTEAIIDRLKREGQLLRNSGKNSIRQTNVELEKFSVAFDSISGAIAEQSTILDGMQNLAADQAEDAKRRADLAELDDGESDTAKEIRMLREKADLFNAKKELDEAKGPGLLDNLISGGAKNLLKNLAIFAGGGYVAFKVIKGFVNEMTDGGFDRFMEDIKNFDFASVGQALSDFGTTAVEFIGRAGPALTSMLQYFDDPLKILLGLSGSVVGAKLLTSIGTSIAGKAIGSLVTGMPGAMSGKAGKGMGKAMMGALGVAGLIYAEDIAKFIRGEARNADIKNFDLRESATSVGISTAGGATIGMMFGPKGALIGAVAGFAYGLGKEIYDFIQDDVLDKGILSNEAEDIIAARRERQKLQETLGDRYQEYIDALPENRRAELITDDEFNERAQAELTRLDAEMAAAQEAFDKRSIYVGNGRSKTLKSALLLEREQNEFDEQMELLRQQRGGLAAQLAGMELDLTPAVPVLEDIGANATPLTPPPDAVINQMPEDMAGKVETVASATASQVQVTVAKGGDSTVINNTNVKGGATQTFTSVNSSGAPVQQDVFGPMQ
jgi:hypothetical protein